MNTKFFKNANEATQFIETLARDDNTVDVIKTDDGLTVTWIKNKKYTDFTGVERTDEVWCKEDGTLVLCQDLEPEHARNIIRMLIRNERNARKAAFDVLSSLEALVAGMPDIDMQDDTNEEPVPRVLH